MAENQLSLRTLPAKKNTLMLGAASPPYEHLVSLRRLGQTHIPTPTTSPPIFCHLPAPLPSDIFSDFRSATTHYYLLRRPSDNFISATCLFRAVFPYANADEKIREFRYLRGIFKAQYEEETGDIWIPGKQAMKLAEEYGVGRWVGALLDPKEVGAVPHEVIDLTLDDSDEEVEVEDDSENEDRRAAEARESQEREEERRARDRKEQEQKRLSETREAERMPELERGVEARAAHANGCHAVAADPRTTEHGS